MVLTKEPLTPVGQIIELTLRDLRHRGINGASLWELIEETGRTEQAVRRGLKRLLQQGLVIRVERKDPRRNCPIATHYRLP